MNHHHTIELSKNGDRIGMRTGRENTPDSNAWVSNKLPKLNPTKNIEQANDSTMRKACVSVRARSEASMMVVNGESMDKRWQKETHVLVHTIDIQWRLVVQKNEDVLINNAMLSGYVDVGDLNSLSTCSSKCLFSMYMVFFVLNRTEEEFIDFRLKHCEPLFFLATYTFYFFFFFFLAFTCYLKGSFSL
ncbi:hypothetical protein L2E82_51231 [Cichorium intybus]|nr:hypothetical protein L2E82_51231 [Cichorium intybus]